VVAASNPVCSIEKPGLERVSCFLGARRLAPVFQELSQRPGAPSLGHSAGAPPSGGCVKDRIAKALRHNEASAELMDVVYTAQHASRDLAR
jgi:hypothetical protein